MLARMQKSIKEKDEGFTLIELLVVIIIIGILAAIAIPVFLNQRKKGQDAAAKADVSTLGKELATYWVDGIGVPTLSSTGTATAQGKYSLSGGSLAVAVDLGVTSKGVELGTPVIIGDTAWCVPVTNAKGDKAVAGFKYTAAAGLQEGTCSSTGT